MVVPEITSQPLFSFEFVGIRPDPAGSGRRQPIHDLLASPGSLATPMSSSRSRDPALPMAGLLLAWM